MVLHALYQLYDRLERESDYGIARPGRTFQRVTFVVVIEPDGTLVDVQDARIERDGRKEPRRALVLGQTKPPGSALNPCFLWDSTGYMLGWDARPEREGRARQAFEAYRDRHLQMEASVAVPGFSSVCRFLEQWRTVRANEFPVLEELATGFGVFQIRGEPSYVHDHPAIQAWWDRRTGCNPERMKAWWQTGESSGDDGAVGQCLITGRSAAIARTHDKIKGVAGSQSSGATIAGFNDSAYWSYGLEQSFNAPVSVEAARRYTSAVNALLGGPMRRKHRLDVGATTVVFWTGRPSVVEDVFAMFARDGSASLEEVQDETVRARLEAFLRALRKGREAFENLAEDPDATPFFIVGLAAPTPARIAVRFFHRGTVAELLGNLRRHHTDIGIERRFRDRARKPEPELPPAWYLLNETRPPGGDVPPLLPPAFLESIVTGARYPDALYSTVVRRVAADRTVNYPRACILKGHLVRNRGKEVSVSLDRSRPDPAYRFGRLFATLEKTQQDALGGNVGATIRDRFYSSASATPAAVFPRLLRTYQHHLSKLEGGHKVNREKLVQEILDPLGDFPAHLGLEDQGLFALGYYHQMNDFYRSKEERNVAATA